MTWLDFKTRSALERDVLSRALPAVASDEHTYRRATYDPKSSAKNVSIGVGDTLGFTPEGCVNHLALRPLLVGTAWKVLDLLLEEALAQAGVAHNHGAEYTIALKEEQARTGVAAPAQFDPTAWSVLMAAYAETVEIRHSLVHRQAHTTPSGDLVGVDRDGQPLRPLTAAEQEAFAHAAVTAAGMVPSTSRDPRDEARLLRHLADLAGLHQRQLDATTIPTIIPEITIVVDPDPADSKRYLINMPAVRAWMPFSDVGDFADVVVAPRDRPGQELRGRLEDAPSEAVTIDFDAPPTWLC